MSISLKKASKALDITEEEVMELISAGKLKADQKGKRLTIDDSALEALLPERRGEPEPAPAKSPPYKRGDPRQISFSDTLVHTLGERISALEKEIRENLGLLDENRRLTRELHDKEGELARGDTEIERLKAELVYQKKLLEKEVDDRRRVLDEKLELMDREVSERIARERDSFEQRIEAQRSIWAERLAREQERFAAALAQAESKQGFWTRLMKMLTWS